MTDTSRCRYNLDSHCPDLAPTLAVASVLTEGRCLADVTLRDDDHRLAICVLPKGHLTPHGDLMGTTWTDADHWQPDHTHAIAEAAREYERIRRAHLDHGPLLSARKAAHEALIAAVEAESADLERGSDHD